MKTGIELISEERQEQIKKHGWDIDHDLTHDSGELAKMAAILAVMDTDASVRDLGGDFSTGEGAWGLENKLSDDPIHRLKVAGALIAAEIDRLQSERKSDIQTEYCEGDDDIAFDFHKANS